MTELHQPYASLMPHHRQPSSFSSFFTTHHPLLDSACLPHHAQDFAVLSRDVQILVDDFLHDRLSPHAEDRGDPSDLAAVRSSASRGLQDPAPLPLRRCHDDGLSRYVESGGDLSHFARVSRSGQNPVYPSRDARNFSHLSLHFQFFRQFSQF